MDAKSDSSRPLLLGTYWRLEIKPVICLFLVHQLKLRIVNFEREPALKIILPKIVSVKHLYVDEFVAGVNIKGADFVPHRIEVLVDSFGLVLLAAHFKHDVGVAFARHIKRNKISSFDNADLQNSVSADTILVESLGSLGFFESVNESFSGQDMLTESFLQFFDSLFYEGLFIKINFHKLVKTHSARAVLVDFLEDFFCDSRVCRAFRLFSKSLMFSEFLP